MTRRMSPAVIVCLWLLAVGFGAEPVYAQCVSSLVPTTRSHGSGSETGIVSVTAPDGCTWTATSNDSWITVLSGTSGTGNGSVTYSVVANGLAARTGTLTIGGQTFTVVQAGAVIPQITSLSPSKVDAGTPAFALTVNGANFLSGCNVLWNGVPLPTTLLSDTELRASVSSADIAFPGAAQVVVANPGGGQSAPATFTILQPPNPVPIITGLSPSPMLVGSSPTLTVMGSGFVPSSEIRWNGVELPTIYGSSLLLTAQVPDTSSPAVALVTVFNRAPGGGTSEPEIFVIASPSGLDNQAPSANAGADQTVARGATVTLDASGSSDADGDPVFYVWSWQARPAGSAASFSDPLAVNPSFVLDEAGDYLAVLQVIDGHGARSALDTVRVSTVNSTPIADAGADQSPTTIGTTVHLDGTRSYDLDGDPIGYRWSFVSRPAGSSAVLTGADTATPEFVPDLYGAFVVGLVVSDPWSQSAPDEVTVSFQNLRPVANAGASVSALVFSSVTFDGTGSFDANGDSLTYSWTLVSAPEGSRAVILDPTTARPGIVPDLPGTFVVQLIVSDGLLPSEASTVQVQATSSATAVVQGLQHVQVDVATFGRGVFKNDSMQNALLNKLNAVVAHIEAGNYAEALEQLENDILGKTNGCAATGAPDKNDWIRDCGAQGNVRDDIVGVVSLIRALM